MTCPGLPVFDESFYLCTFDSGDFYSIMISRDFVISKYRHHKQANHLQANDLSELTLPYCWVNILRTMLRCDDTFDLVWKGEYLSHSVCFNHTNFLGCRVERLVWPYAWLLPCGQLVTTQLRIQNKVVRFQNFRNHSVSHHPRLSESEESLSQVRRPRIYFQWVLGISVHFTITLLVNNGDRLWIEIGII